MASWAPAAQRRIASAKSTIRIAFFLTIPMSNKMPMSAMTLKSVRNNSSASNAPMLADGNVDRIVMG